MPKIATFDYWPQNPNWSFQFLRLITSGIGGGSEFSECHLAVSKMQVGNVDDWHNGFMSLASRIEQWGDQALEGKHLISARDCYLRASNYYRAAEYFLKPGDSKRDYTYNKCRTCFQKASSYFSPPMEYVDIPYEKTALYGHFYHTNNPGPGGYKVLILLEGADSVAEELYASAVKAIVDRGFACLVVEGPGQGASIRLRNIRSRFDYEVPVKAAIDYLETRKDVNPDYIALAGPSLAGYYAARAAAFEKRLKACICWAIMYDVGEEVRKLGVQLPHIAEQTAWQLGTKNFDETLEVLKKFTLKGVIDKVACPLLIIHGEDDRLVPVSHAYRAYEEAQGDKTLKIIKSGEPGAEHCQVDCFSVAHYHIFNWLEDKLK